MATLPTPIFIDNDPSQIISEMVSWMEDKTGKPLPAGDPFMLMINMAAERESRVRAQMQSACLQMLLAFSQAPMIDYIAQLVGVTRLQPSPARCTLSFTLSSDHIDLFITKGTRVQTSDGLNIFETIEDKFVAAGTTSVTVTAECQTSGVAGNNYAINKVNNLIDPQAYILSVVNTDVTIGGFDQESDEQLRQRVILAPSAFSTAGPDEAYKFFAFSASPAIIDVAVHMPTPGSVAIYPMIDGGIETPSDILDLVDSVCNDKKVRPLTDTVNVYSPSKVEFSLTINITKISGAINSDIINNVTTMVQNYLNLSQRKLGRNITVTKIKSLCMYDDTQVYDVSLGSFTDLTIDYNEFAYCTTLTVNVTGEVTE